MASRARITAGTFIAVAATVLAAAPAFANDAQRRRARENPSTTENERTAPPEQARARERAVPRAAEPRREEQNRVSADVHRPPEIRRDVARRNDNGRYGYAVPRRYTPRVIRPSVVRVIPYRPYVYRPSYSIGVYYGSGGYYPYGYTPRGYFDPLPGRYYGGVRIMGAPRDARVFADGYYVGIVNDFDGVFQHMNLEAGPHHIEIDLGYDGMAFDVYVRPGETTTLRADGYYRP
jgi:hypothetical protein